MKSLFDIGFRKPFMPLHKSREGLGQDEPQFITSYDQGPESSGDIPGLYTSVDQGPPSTGNIPGLYTSIDQDTRPTSPVASLVTEKDLVESLKNPTPATDWGKLAQALVKAAGSSSQAYGQAQSTFNSARLKAGLPAMPLGTAAALQSPGIDPNVIFLVGGLAAVTLLVVLARA